MNNVEYIKLTDPSYPSTPPFNPSEKYPEYPFSYEWNESPNPVYRSFRSLLLNLGLDMENYNTENWNPLQSIVHPGDTILIKPNLVSDSHYLDKSQFEATVTHPSLIRAIIDYVFIAGGTSCKIIIADGPLESTDFADTAIKSGLDTLIHHMKVYNKLNIELRDLRHYMLEKQLSLNILNYELAYWRVKHLENESNKSILVDLGSKSKFSSIEDEKIKKLRAGTDGFSAKISRTFHESGHKYGISNCVLESDVIINVSKLKTHKIAGNSLCLKNMIGIINPRYMLPHYMEDSDEYEKPNILFKTLKRARDIIFRKGSGGFLLRKKNGYFRIPIKGANPQNDTIWRCIIDINKISMYSDKNGFIKDSIQRRTLCFVDGVIGGEGYGPLVPEPIKCGLIIGGNYPLDVDLMATKLMGFDYTKIKTLRNAFDKDYPLGHISTLEIINEIENTFSFKPPYNWKNKIEYMV